MKSVVYIISVVFFSGLSLVAQIKKAPERTEGQGPFNQLIIRGITLIDGTGAPARGPVDIVVKQNKIIQIKSVGFPGVSIDPLDRPKLEKDGHEIDGSGKYMLPGFVDMHGHIGGMQGPYAEYVFKLWMAHGITTIRDPGGGNGLTWAVDQRAKSALNKITAPRIKFYTVFGEGRTEPFTTQQEVIDWVVENKNRGADGIKFFGAAPQFMDAALRKNKSLGLRSSCHHAQMDVARWNVLHSAEAGLTTMEHWYGLPEAMLSGSTVQNYPLDYNYLNEQDRFENAGRLWKEAAPPFSEKWNAVMNQLLKLDFTLDPTFNTYEGGRDLQRARTQEWHQEYTLPQTWKFYQPSRTAHASFWYNWGTEQEIAWRKNFQLWMTFINEYKNRGGRVTVGSDNAYSFQLYGFGYIRELELFREAGFHPLEVIRSATLYGAQALGMAKEIGSIEPGKLADFIIIDQNPLQNLQVLYGTGAIMLDENNKAVRKGGIMYTVKDGIIYDSKQLLKDVRNIVEMERKNLGFVQKQPGVE